MSATSKPTAYKPWGSEEWKAEANRLRSINTNLVAAAHRALAALAAYSASNCEAAKELRAAIAKAEGR